MHERIKQFERESHLDVYGLGKDSAKWEDTLDKFTKLIVQDCIAQVESLRGYSGYNDEHIVSTPDWGFTLKAVQELINNMYKES